MAFSYTCTHTHAHIFTGETGIVYRGYIDSRGYKDMVAIKTCKGMKLYLKLIVDSYFIICIP